MTSDDQVKFNLTPEEVKEVDGWDEPQQFHRFILKFNNYDDPRMRFLSNSYISEFSINGRKYRNVLHYYLSAKAERMGDTETAAAIHASKSPSEWKRLSKSIKDFNEERWSRIKDGIIRWAVKEKFKQNPRIKDLLAKTLPYNLVYATDEDPILGTGFAFEDARNFMPELYKDGNRLGRILEDTREEFRRKAKDNWLEVQCALGYKFDESQAYGTFLSFPVEIFY